MSTFKTVVWKGYDLLVSEDGRIKRPELRSEYTTVQNGVERRFLSRYPEKEIEPYLTKGGYLEIKFQHNRKVIKAHVHRLVAIAFVPGFSPEKHVNHVDGDKRNNRPENLEWVTKGENTKHAWETGLVDLRGDNQPRRKLNSRQVAHIRRALKKGFSAHSLSVIAGVSMRLICMIRDGQRWAEHSD